MQVVCVDVIIVADRGAVPADDDTDRFRRIQRAAAADRNDAVNPVLPHKRRAFVTDRARRIRFALVKDENLKPSFLLI